VNFLRTIIFKISSTAAKFAVMAYRKTPNWDDAWSSA